MQLWSNLLQQWMELVELSVEGKNRSSILHKQVGEEF